MANCDQESLEYQIESRKLLGMSYGSDAYRTQFIITVSKKKAKNDCNTANSSPIQNKPVQTHMVTHPNPIIHHHALDQLIPTVVLNKSGIDLVKELSKNNLANKIIDVYYRIKKNVEYISQGKDSLYPVTPAYNTSGTNLLNSYHSRQYFYLISKHLESFGYLIQYAAHYVEHNKMYNVKRDYRINF